jgi:beta-glucosidase-like glycosyl hydrolase
MMIIILTCGLVLTSCSSDNDSGTMPTDEMEALLQKMTLREKVGQMFYIRMESLDPSIEWTTFDDLAELKNQEVTMKMRHTNEQYPVGGIKAGVDIVLGPRDFIEAFDAVIAAVNNGTISEERINQSVRRILTLRLGMNRQIN